LSTVVNVDRVVVIRDGRIVAMGCHDALLRSSAFYRRLVETQLLAQ
jgi:ATP-binding cassette subfamily B protein